MTKKDYILLARAIRDHLDDCGSDVERATMRLFTSMLMSRLKQDNMDFDRDKFWNAAIHD